MKTWATLAAAAALTIGTAAHAAEPMKLDDAALDGVTAGSFFLATAQSLGASANFLSDFGVGTGSIQESFYAFGERELNPSGESLSLLAKGSGQSFASGPGLATAAAAGFVSISVISFSSPQPVAER
jgi:hypothetical protein